MANDQDLAGLPEDAKQVPLHELLAAVPMNARALEGVGEFMSRNHPVGRLCHEAGAELLRLARENAELREQVDYAGRLYDQAQRGKDEAEAELAALKKRIDEAPTCTLRAIVQGDIVWPVASDLSGDTRVALLPVGGE